MAYLPGYNLGCMDKSAEFVERMVIKLCAWNLNVSDLVYISITVINKGF